MNASRLRSNKEESSELQETNGFDTDGRDSSFSSARLHKNVRIVSSKQVFPPEDEEEGENPFTT